MPSKKIETKSKENKTVEKKQKLDKYYYAKGRRKTSVATIRLFEGTGVSMINNKELKEVYVSELDRKTVNQPLALLDRQSDFYFTSKVSGGGKSSQMGAIIHALSRALVVYDESLKSELKKAGFIKRDPRMVERKHTGRRKARKKEQYSKR